VESGDCSESKYEGGDIAIVNQATIDAGRTGIYGNTPLGDYDTSAHNFNFSGLRAGGYATYLKGGLFVDTLVKADFLDVEQRVFGFPNSIDATNFGIRTDSGYRFGRFDGGFFLEPLATIEVIWSHLEGVTLGGNTVSFDSDPAVRGRLGLGAGTSFQAWEGTRMEPFVIGSVWSHLSGDNQATLTSNGTRFTLSDSTEDVWAWSPAA
jgi:outer membrane autotransporter protein